MKEKEFLGKKVTLHTRAAYWQFLLTIAEFLLFPPSPAQKDLTNNPDFQWS